MDQIAFHGSHRWGLPPHFQNLNLTPRTLVATASQLSPGASPWGWVNSYGLAGQASLASHSHGELFFFSSGLLALIFQILKMSHLPFNQLLRAEPSGWLCEGHFSKTKHTAAKSIDAIFKVNYHFW